MYTVIAEGKVLSCRKRSNGYIIGVRTKQYLVEHYRNDRDFKIGETVKIMNDPDRGDRLEAVTS